MWWRADPHLWTHTSTCGRLHLRVALSSASLSNGTRRAPPTSDPVEEVHEEVCKQVYEVCEEVCDEVCEEAVLPAPAGTALLSGPHLAVQRGSSTCRQEVGGDQAQGRADERRRRQGDRWPPPFI